MKEERIIFKADIHVHTPASRCFKDEKSDDTYIEILKQAKNKKLSILAITDHNSIEGYKKIIEIRGTLQDELQVLKGIDDSEQAERKRKELIEKLKFFENILIIPGIEFEVNNGIHILCLFNPSTEVSSIENFIKNGGYDEGDYGFESGKKISKWDIFRFLEETKKYDCIVVDAHTDSDKGILETIKNGLPRVHCLNNAQLRGLCYKSEKQRSLLEKTFEVSQDYQREIPLAFLKSSDAHSIKEIGRDITFFQLKELTFDGFKESFKNPIEYISTTIPAVKNIVENIIQTGKVITLTELNFEEVKRNLCAFNNSTGGFLILGVNEFGGIIGYPSSEVDMIFEKIIESTKALPDSLEFDLNPYPVQNDKYIIVLNIKKGEKLIDIENDGIIWTFDSKKVKKLTALEVENLIEKKLTVKLQDKITPRLRKIESDSLEIKNILHSFPIVQKFEQKSLGIYSLITEPKYRKPISLNEKQKNDIENYVKNKNNGKSKGNLFYFEDISAPRLNHAYLRYSIPKYYLKGIENHTKKDEHIVVVPGGATYFTTKQIEHFNKHNLGIIEFKSNDENFSNKLICCFLKSSFFLWYFRFKYGAVDFFGPSNFKNIQLPQIVVKNPNHSKVVDRIEILFDKMLELETDFLKIELNPENEDYEEIIEKHNERSEEYAYEIDSLIYKLVELTPREIEIIESSLKANNLFIKENN